MSDLIPQDLRDITLASNLRMFDSESLDQVNRFLESLRGSRLETFCCWFPVIHDGTLNPPLVDYHYHTSMGPNSPFITKNGYLKKITQYSNQSGAGLTLWLRPVRSAEMKLYREDKQISPFGYYVNTTYFKITDDASQKQIIFSTLHSFPERPINRWEYAVKYNILRKK